MAEVFVNLITTTLAAAVTTTNGTTISVASSTGFPTSSSFRILIDSELMLVTGISGTTWTVSRGIESTTAATHENGAAIYPVLTAENKHICDRNLDLQGNSLTTSVTNGNIKIIPNGTGAIVATKPTVARGTYAVDLQCYSSSDTYIASGAYSVISGGNTNKASGQYATVGGGTENTATGNYSSIAGGTLNFASGQHSAILGGEYNQATNEQAIVLGGQHSTATGAGSIAGGWYCEAKGNYSVACGLTNVADQSYGIAMGASCHAQGIASRADGMDCYAQGDYSHAEGRASNATGHYSHAEGRGSHADCEYSHSEGCRAIAYAAAQHAFGCEAEGSYSGGINPYLCQRTDCSCFTQTTPSQNYCAINYTPLSRVVVSASIDVIAIENDTGAVCAWKDGKAIFIVNADSTIVLIYKNLGTQIVSEFAGSWDFYFNIGQIVFTATNSDAQTSNWHFALHTTEMQYHVSPAPQGSGSS